MIIYKITNTINNKVYIGLTTNTLKYRWSRHLTEARNKKNNKHLYRAIRKYGENNFTIEIIEETKDFSVLGEKERYYIKYYNSTNRELGYNLTCGGEKNQYDGNSQAKLKVEDVKFIRSKYNECELSVKQCWEIYYPNMSYSGFQKIWDGITWKGIMDFVYTNDNIDFHKRQKSLPGERNGNSLFCDNEVIEIRKYYTTHTLDETFEKYKKYKTQKKSSFRNVIDCAYKHLPIYSKVRKGWFLNGNKIEIDEYKPVSTISESGE